MRELFRDWLSRWFCARYRTWYSPLLPLQLFVLVVRDEQHAESHESPYADSGNTDKHADARYHPEFDFYPVDGNGDAI